MIERIRNEKLDSVFERVLTKISYLREELASFSESVPTRWLFSWDSTADNFEDAQKEMDVLRLLNEYGYMQLTEKPNPTHFLTEDMEYSPTFKDYSRINPQDRLKGHRKYLKSDDNLINSTVEQSRNDSIYQFDTVCWITAIDRTKLDKLQTNKNRILAEMLVEGESVKVKIDDKKYTIYQLRDGMKTTRIINEAYANEGSKLDSETKKLNIKAKENIKEIFKGNSHIDSVLKDFVELTAKTICINRKAYISTATAEAITSNAKKYKISY